MTEGKARPVRVPGRDECLRMLSEHGCDRDVVEHCKAVADLALRVARRCGADEGLVEAGALLHDIGRCRTHAVSHAVEGAKLASGLGLPPQVVRIIERHIGGGITRAEAKRLGLPQKDYTPRTLEETVVAHSDNLFSGTRRTTVKEAVAQLVRKGMDGPASRVLDMHRRLSDACGCDVDDIA